MNVLEEHIGPVSIARLVECDCLSCRLGVQERAFLLASVPERAALWVTVAHGEIGPLQEAVERVLDDDPEEDELPANAVIESGLALVGLPWEKLRYDECLRQLECWARLPDWMSRVPRAQLWACRAVVFGDDVTRVPRAMFAVERFYRPDSPASREDLALFAAQDPPAVDGPPDMGGT